MATEDEMLAVCAALQDAMEILIRSAGMHTSDKVMIYLNVLVGVVGDCPSDDARERIVRMVEREFRIHVETHRELIRKEQAANDA